MAVTTFASETFPEEGIRVISCSFTDEDGTAVTPDSVAWTLTKRPKYVGDTATVINSREDVSETPSTTVNIVLSGDDLALLTAEVDDNEAFVERELLVKFVYDSTYGNNLPGRARYIFRIDNFSAVT